MNFSVRSVVATAFSILLLTFVAGCGANVNKAVKGSGVKTLNGAVSANIKLDRSKKTYGKCSCKKVFKCKNKKKPVAANSKAAQVKLAQMREMCEHNIAIKGLVKSGTARDIGRRASKISALAKKLKYGSVVFYANQVKESAEAIE